MVEQRLNIVYLMGGDDQRAILRHILGHHLTELRLRRDVKTVCRLVHQQQLCTSSKGKAHEHLLLLAHRESVQLQVCREFKVLQTVLQHFRTEHRIERTVNLHILIERHVRQIKFLRHDKDLAQSFRLSLTGFDAIETNRTLLRTEQSTDKIQERRLTRAILTQQTVDVVFLQLQAEIIEYQILLTCVLKTDVTYLYHNVKFLFDYSLVIVYYLNSTLQKYTNNQYPPNFLEEIFHFLTLIKKRKSRVHYLFIVHQHPTSSFRGGC